MDGEFDVVLLHLVISVVPQPSTLVKEVTRVLDHVGRISIYDKFVPEGSSPSLAWRAVNHSCPVFTIKKRPTHVWRIWSVREVNGR